MADYAGPIQELIDAFGRLPGIGPKSAQRITFHLLKVDKTESQRLIAAVTNAIEKVVAVERTREFRGRYHVLGGAIDHLQGIGPEQLKIRELLGRVQSEAISEVIVCTNPNIEGEATALYLTRLLDVPGLTVSRIASGLPVGGDLEYADELTLGRALEGRRVMER